MATRRSKEPSQSRSLTARLAHLRPSQRQRSKWQREQEQERLIRVAVVIFAIVVVLVLGFGFLRESFLRGRETVADVYGQTITLSQVVDRARPAVGRNGGRLAESLRERGRCGWCAQQRQECTTANIAQSDAPAYADA